jgi:HAD superfamily hydrolase (TIGR01549 family)
MADGPIAILDVDGTLIDTNYHHALAWHRALRQFDCKVPLYRLHRHMGMGGDQLVASVAGEEFDERHGEEVRDAEKERYGELIDEVAPLAGAQDLIAALSERGCRVILASSAKEEEIEHYIELLDAPDIEYTTSADVEETKPEPDLVLAALEKMGGEGTAIMVGDSTWDCEAAKRAGVKTIALLTGGFSREELMEAGAVEVYAELPDLIADLDRLVEEASHATSES